jgi:hypothetical protein
LQAARVEFIDENGGGPGVRCTNLSGQSNPNKKQTSQNHPRKARGVGFIGRTGERLAFGKWRISISTV